MSNMQVALYGMVCLLPAIYYTGEFKKAVVSYICHTNLYSVFECSILSHGYNNTMKFRRRKRKEWRVENNSVAWDKYTSIK